MSGRGCVKEGVSGSGSVREGVRRMGSGKGSATEQIKD